MLTVNLLTKMFILSGISKYALKTSLNNLNPPSEFDDSKAFEKKVITHRIVNLMNLTEVHKSNLSK